jgi:RNA polymerase sigma-70 factor (ECF subfamily)
VTTETDRRQTDHDHDQLAQARAGSHRAFRVLVEPYAAELQRHCYRMTGSMDDADDLVQETLFRAWRGLGTYVSRGSFRAWLYRIATNRTLDLLKSAPRQREINSAGEPPWLQPYPTQESPDLGEHASSLETIGLAFIVALQHLPGNQRAALILRDVLGFSAVETADIVGSSVPAANSALQRARARLAEVHPTRPAAPSTAEQRAAARRFLLAWQADDTEALVQVLHETAHMTMPPHPLEVFCARRIAEFLQGVRPEGDPANVCVRDIAANVQCGLAVYFRQGPAAPFTRHCLMLFAPAAASKAIGRITGFTEARIFDLFGLPVAIEETSASSTPT